MFSNAMIYEKMRKMALLRKMKDEEHYINPGTDVMEEANMHMQAGMSGNWGDSAPMIPSQSLNDIDLEFKNGILYFQK